MVLGPEPPARAAAWADEIGLDHVLAVLEALCEEYREERYRPAPALRRLVRGGRLGRAAGAGFFDYDADEPEGDLTFSRPARVQSHVSAGAAPLSALSRRAPRRRVALPGLLGRPRGGRGLLPGDVHRGAARLSAAARGLEPARVGADDRPPQGARRAPRRGRGGRCRSPSADAVDGTRSAPRGRGRATRRCGRRSASCPRASARRSCCATSATCPTARSRRRSAARRRRRGARCTRD